VVENDPFEGDDGVDDVVHEIGDEIDLHTFRPKDISSLIPDYLDACVERGYIHVRIIHGKGKGVQRRIVHSALERDSRVKSFTLADGGAGSWGATLVELKGTEE